MDKLYSYTFIRTNSCGDERKIETLAMDDSTAWVAAAEIAGRLLPFPTAKLELFSKQECKIVLV